MSTTEIISDEQIPTRWYKEPYVWMLIAIPASAVIVAAIMITLALESEDGLVADDYYKRGLEINQSLARDRTALELGLHASLNLAAGQPTRVSLGGHGNVDSPATLLLSFRHATRSGHDQQLLLHKVDTDSFIGEPLVLPEGIWQVQLETPDWRLLKTIRTPVSSTIRLDAS